jgi:uncharacterized RDD family membrane protein YckC
VAPYGPPAQGGYPQPGYGQPVGYPQPGYGAAPQYAGFWIRFVAALIDGFIITIAVTLLCITIIGILLTPLAIIYMPYMWWKKGATFGQSMLGLRVVRAVDGGPIDGQAATIRLIGYWVASWACYLGLIWVAFEPRKRGWHDMMADTVVIHTN